MTRRTTTRIICNTLFIIFSYVFIIVWRCKCRTIIHITKEIKRKISIYLTFLKQRKEIGLQFNTSTGGGFKKKARIDELPDFDNKHICLVIIPHLTVRFSTYCIIPPNARWSKSKLMLMKIDFHTHETKFSRRGNIF